MKITNVRAILTAPSNIGLCVVKVETDQPGLYGLGCATFTQRLLATRSAVEDYLKPLLIGRDPERIEEIWHLCYQNSYWRNSPVLNNMMIRLPEQIPAASSGGIEQLAAAYVKPIRDGVQL